MSCFVINVSFLSCTQKAPLYLNKTRTVVLTNPLNSTLSQSQSQPRASRTILTAAPATGHRLPATCRELFTAAATLVTNVSARNVSFSTATFCCRFAGLPPSRATSLLRSCNQSCTDSGLHAHFSCSLSLYIRGCAFRKDNADDVFVQNAGVCVLMCVMGCGRYLRTGVFSPRYVARPSCRAYHRRPALIPGIQAAVWACARRRVWVWILFVSPPNQTEQRAHTRSAQILD